MSETLKPCPCCNGQGIVLSAEGEAMQKARAAISKATQPSAALSNSERTDG